MEIEIITTKKKLTKSLVNQIQYADNVTIRYGEPLGFIIGVIKNCHRAILIKYHDNYSLIPADYQKGNISVYRKIGRWSQTRKFDTEDKCNAWWKDYQEVLKKAADQIYI